MDKLTLIVLFAVGSVFVILLIKKYAPEYAVVASLSVSCIIIFFVVADIGEIIKTFTELVSQTGGQGKSWAESIVKVTAISFVGQWGSGLCRDSGENSIADKLETSVKIIILIICLPYINTLFTVAKNAI